MSKRPQFSAAELVSGGSSIQLAVLQQLMAGIAINVNVDGVDRSGCIHRLDIAPGTDHCFAELFIEDPNNGKEKICVRVAIHTNGQIDVLPDQPEE